MADLNTALTRFKPDTDAAKVYHYLFAKSGFTRDVHKYAKEPGIHLAHVDEMF